MEPNDLLAYLETEIASFVRECPGNYITPQGALTPSSVGVRMFDDPLITVGAANDPMFEQLKKPEAVGPQTRLPGDWLGSANSVISYFLPMTEHVRESNLEGELASAEWMHARIDGQAFILSLGKQVERLLQDAGYEAVCPACHPDLEVMFRADDPAQSYTSNWSERHVGFVCGMGTFSLSRGIITERGMAGRLGSVVTNAVLPTTERAYTEIDEYCIKCGQCIDRCPANAISFETGKDHYACHDMVTDSKKVFPGYYGCGKCQVGVPCESSRP